MTESTLHYHVGHNTPGYLPESDVFITDDLDGALTAYHADLERAAESLEERATDSEVESGERSVLREAIAAIDAAQQEARQAMRPTPVREDALRRVPLWHDVLDSDRPYALPVRYWVHSCDRDDCERDDG